MYGLLEGKKALVTGGAQGIGRAVAKIYAENGADVMIADMNKEMAEDAARKIAQKTGQEIGFCGVDVSNAASVAEMAECAVKKMGRLDVLCHAAGILIHAEILQMTEKQWDTIFAVNAKGTFLVDQAVARQMIKTGGGKIVNISSCSAKKPTYEEAGYCATKGAVGAFLRVAALEWGPYGICVNGVCPGATDTPMVRSTFITSPDIEKEWVEKTALKRLGTPLDQARAVLFLSSPLADHITGESLIVSGGELMGQ